MSFQLYLSLASELFCCSLFLQLSLRTDRFIFCAEFKTVLSPRNNLTLLLFVGSCLIFAQYSELFLSLASDLYLQLDSDYSSKEFSPALRNSFMSLLRLGIILTSGKSERQAAGNMSVIMANICVNMSALRTIFLFNQLFELFQLVQWFCRWLRFKSTYYHESWIVAYISPDVTRLC